MEASSVKLFSPGPTPLSPESLEILSRPQIHHRSARFKSSVQNSMELLKKLFDSDCVVVFNSTGSGAMEASVLHAMIPEGHALCLNGGKFGERWAEILSHYSFKYTELKFDWGQEPDYQQLEEKMKEIKPQALFVQACETSTGTLYKVDRIAESIAKNSPETLLVVDGITAVGALPLSVKKNKIDFLVSGSQKALGIPTGLSFIGLSEKAREACKNSPNPSYYFNVQKELNSLEKGNTRYSGPTQLWLCLEKELEKLFHQGLKSKYENCLALQAQVQTWLKTESKLQLFSKSPSPSLTALLLPPEISALEVQNKMLERSYFLAAGQGDYKNRLLRIGHMANVTTESLNEMLKELSLCLKDYE